MASSPDYQTEGEYQAQLRWNWEPRWHGYKGTPVTAADDFAKPYEPTLEELLEELI